MEKGLIVALVTPFLENEEIDLEGFRHIISMHAEQKIAGLLVSGSTGESPTISFAEWEALIAIAVDESRGRVPILAGVGSNNTKISVQKAMKAKELGATYAMAEFPYYNRPTFEGCIAHFQKITEVGIPLVIYNHPGRCAVRFSAKELAKLCEMDGIVALKDCSGDLSFSKEFMSLSAKPLFSGDDPLALEQIQEGASGVVSVLGNLLLPEWAEIIELALQGDMKQAKALYGEIEALCHSLFLEINPQCVKYAMHLRGYCHPNMRLPLLVPKEITQEKIAKDLEAFLQKSRLLPKCV